MKTMIRHITFLMAVAMMVLLGGGCAEVNEAQQKVQSGVTSDAIGFDIYTQRAYTRAGTAGDVTTDGLKDGTHSGFGVFAYYTGENSYDENIVPNFMYNQKVAYNSSAFDYSPIKYWPNETNNDHISFFAYAPWVAVDATTGVTTGDQTYGIIGVSKNTFTGAPLVNYIATTDLSKGVDLCWGKQLNKQKPNDGSKVNFTLSHSLAQLNVQVKSSIALDENTKIYIRSISFSGFTMKGALNLNNTSGTTPLWLGYDGLGRLNKDAVTIYDGRRDGREGSLADANEGLTGLNPDLVQSTPWDDASPKPGVTSSSTNLFENSSATTTPAYAIPTGDPVDVTIEYDIETKDDNLKGYYLSDGKTYGTSLTNRITKRSVLAKLDAGKSYTLTLNLGIQDITFEASSVKDWKNDDPELVPLTFEAMEAGATVKFKLYSFIIGSGKVQYSIDEGDTWQDYTSEQLITLNNVGDMVQFKSTNITYYATDHYTSNSSSFTVSGNCYVYGNILSLVNFNKTLSGYDPTFYGLFYNCSTLHNHPINKLLLPATTLVESCYAFMFYGCTSLTQAPELPATELQESCYDQMFCKCTSLTTAPNLPATTLAKECYYYMFSECTNLTQAPTSLPATEMKESCYSGMFSECTSLINPPALPATTLAKKCYYFMFYECNNLASAPALSATTLAESCYAGMFSECTSLTNPPALPATNLAEQCYYYMFSQCTSLTNPPTLSATTLYYQCYRGMFKNCRNLSTAPDLPATTLAEECYYEMFYNCKNLTSAPDLPAPTLVTKCYYTMFSSCTSLNRIKCLATDISASSCTSSWLSGVAASGTFTSVAGVSWSTGANGIPSGWTKVGMLGPVTSNITIADGWIITGTLGSNHKISIDDGATITLSDATINGVHNSSCYWAGLNCEGSATIILADGTTNTVRGFWHYYPGIHVPSTKTLTIQGSGALNASSNGQGAGIGGGWNTDCGNIIINGGTITATGGLYAAGIGCGGTNTGSPSCGDITINGGTITANGGSRGAGIGAGFTNGSCGNITISGGTVEASGGNNGGAGIGGGGYNGRCGDITISGGEVTATGGGGDEGATGIGSGRQASYNSITISGGTVIANGGTNGAGIGTGYCANGGDILISGGTVTATGSGNYSVGIGAGYGSSYHCGNITIENTVTRVTATKSANAVHSIGICYSGRSNCGTVTIGGVVGAISTSPYTYEP